VQVLVIYTSLSIEDKNRACLLIGYIYSGVTYYDDREMDDDRKFGDEVQTKLPHRQDI
jgi:hypothetical protein